MSNFRVVACGGGSPIAASRPHFEIGLQMTGKQKPNLLCVTTAKSTLNAHIRITTGMKRVFGDEAGLPYRVFHDFGVLPTPSQATEMLDWADIVCFSGGNTKRMMEQWQHGGLTQIITHHIVSGNIVAVGISAGLLALFAGGLSDSQSYEVAEGEKWGYMLVEGLGIFDALACPHFETSHPQTGEPRSNQFVSVVRSSDRPVIGIGADSLAAMQIIGDNVTFHSANSQDGFHRLTPTSIDRLDHLTGPISLASLIS